MNLSVGERAETVMRCRTSGNHGEYLGADVGVWGRAMVDGMTFEVGSHHEFGPFDVVHVESGRRQTIHEKHEIPLAIDRLAVLAAIPSPAVIKVETERFNVLYVTGRTGQRWITEDLREAQILPAEQAQAHAQKLAEEFLLLGLRFTAEPWNDQAA